MITDEKTLTFMRSLGINPNEMAEEERDNNSEKDELLLRNYKFCNIPEKFKLVTFENTKHEYAEKIENFALNGKGVLILEGGNGTGKTRLACAAQNSRILRLLNGGRYLSCFYEVCPLIRASRSFRAEKNELDTLREIYNLPFLVLDEVGKGDDAIISKAFVTEVLAARYDNELPTLITTNLFKQELIEFVGKDIESRLKETATMLILDGKDWRKSND